MEAAQNGRGGGGWRGREWRLRSIPGTSNPGPWLGLTWRSGSGTVLRTRTVRNVYPTRNEVQCTGQSDSWIVLWKVLWCWLVYWCAIGTGRFSRRKAGGVATSSRLFSLRYTVPVLSSTTLAMVSTAAAALALSRKLTMMIVAHAPQRHVFIESLTP